MALGFALTGLVEDVRGLALTVVVWTTGEIIIAGVGPTIVATLAPPHLQGTYAGVSGMSWSLGAVVAPVLGSALLPAGPVVLWSTIGGVGLATASGALLAVDAVRRRARAGQVELFGAAPARPPTASAPA